MPVENPGPEVPGIPRVFHRVWIGGPMPEEYVRYGERWLELHPGWTMRTWGEGDLDVVEDRGLFDRLTPVSAKSNLLRYSVLWRHGGVYLDTDFEPIRNIEDLLIGEQMVVGEEFPGLICNAFIASVPGHPALRLSIDAAAESFDSQPDLISPYRTGPHHFTRSIQRAVATTGCAVTVLPRDLLYPYNYEQHDLPAVTFPGSAAVHRWAQTWVTPNAPTPSAGWARRAVRRSMSGTKRFVRRVQAAWDHAEPVTERRFPPMQSAYLGRGRLLVRTPTGIPLVVSGDDLMLTPSMILDGGLDAPFLRFVSRELRRGDVAVDVGANVGLVTLTMAAAVGITGRVFAFEPNERSAEFLAESLYLNAQRGMKAEVVLTRAAVGAANGVARLVAPVRHRSLGRVMDAVSPPSTDDAGVDGPGVATEVHEVPMVTLDDALAAVPFVRLVKIDVEGYESEVLAGMQRLVAERRIGAIDLEISSRHAGPRWPALVSHLRLLQTDHGATFARIAPDSSTTPITLERALHTNHIDHLLIRFPG